MANHLKEVAIIGGVLLLIVGGYFGYKALPSAASTFFSGPGVGPADPWTSTTTPSDAITQRIWGRDLKLTGYESLSCLGTDSNGMLQTGTCGGGGSAGNWFTPTAYGNATSTLIGFNAGLISIGSTTLNGNATTTGMHSIGSLYINSERFTDLTGTGLSISSGALTNSGVTSNVAGNGISVSGATGAVTITNTIGYPFLANATSTTISFGGGLVSNGSTTIAGLTSGLVGNSNGLLYGFASTSLFGYIPLNPTRQLTVAGTANQITSSAGAQDLSADRTWTLSLPSHVIFPSSYQATNGSTTNATSTNLSVTGSSTLATLYGAGLATCNSGNVLTWSGGSFGCAADQTSAGGANPFTWTTNFGVITAATTSILNATAGIFASSTSHFTLASTTALNTRFATTTFATTTQQTITGNLWLTALSAGGLAIDGAGKVYSGPTSTLSTISGSLALTQLAAQAANTVIGNGTGASAVPTAISTTSLFAATPGQVLTFQNGVWSGVGTTTNSCSSGVSCSYSGTTWSFTNSGVTSNVAGTGISVSGATGAVTITNTIGFPFTPATNFGVNTNATSTIVNFTVGLFASSTSRMHALLLGSTTPMAFTNAGLVVTGNTNTFTQAVIQNTSTGNNASSLLAVHADIGSDTTYYTELGINNSGYSQSAFASQNRLDSFLLSSDNALVLGTASTTNTLADIRFIAGGTASTSIRMIIKPNGTVGIASTTPSPMWGLSIATTTVFGNTQFGGFIASTTAAASYTVNWESGNTQRFILNQNSTFIINATSSNPRDGFKYLLKLCQDGTGSRTATFATPGQLVWSAGTTTVTSTANRATYIGMVYDARAQRYDVIASSTNLDARSCTP